MTEEFALTPDSPKPSTIFYSSGEEAFSEESLREASPEMQKDVMRNWFYENYEDPVNNSPYDSEEGGYVFIWGGPYDPQEQLQEMFTGIVPDKVIDELAEHLSNIAAEWTDHTDASEIDDYITSASPSSIHYATFAGSLNDIRALLGISVLEAQQGRFRGLLYAGVIHALEAYLSDVCISRILNDPIVLRRFVETYPEFMKRKIRLSEIFAESEKIKDEARAFLAKFVWHRLERTKLIFEKALVINFPSQFKELFEAIGIRHDLVHRNGKTPNGAEHDLTNDNVRELIEKVNTFVSEIERQLAPPVKDPDETEF